jgi:hypothetical protein
LAEKGIWHSAATAASKAVRATPVDPALRQDAAPPVLHKYKHHMEQLNTTGRKMATLG